MPKTNFTAGGLVVKDDALLSGPRIATPKKTPLKWYDGRCYCLPANHQGSTSSCAGQTTAGYVEVTEWARTQIAKQRDGFKIYEKAKELDGDNSDGTTLTQAVQAAKDLGMLDTALACRTIRTKKEVQYALHRHRAVIAGFMITDAWNHCGTDGWVPDTDDEAIGGHAVLLCWYNDNDKYQTGIGFQNSWGGWGCNGFGRISWKAFQEQFLYAVVLE